MGRFGPYRSRTSLPGMFLGGWIGLLAISLSGAPPNNDFANAIVLTGLTNFVTGNNAGANWEPFEPHHADLDGGKSVWWSWQAPFTGSVGVSTLGSSFDTLLGVYTGESVSNLQAVADNDDAGGFGVTT